MLSIDQSRPGSNIILPDFLILGAAKSGTTSLYFYLRQHPDIFLPQDVKEPGYLAFAECNSPQSNPATPYPNIWNSVVFQRERYLKLFSGAKPVQMVGEATPEYLYLHNDTVKNIRKLYGERARDLKFIVVLRNPIDRIWSHYWMYIRDGYEGLSFDTASDDKTIRARLDVGWHPSYDYVGFGKYADQIAAWRDAFGAEAIKVILFDELKSSAPTVCSHLYEFLGVTSGFCPQTEIAFNKSGKLRHEWVHEHLFRRESLIKSLARTLIPYESLQEIKHRLLEWNTNRISMPPEIRRRLVDLYRPDIERLAAMLEKDLSHWLLADGAVPNTGLQNFRASK